MQSQLSFSGEIFILVPQASICKRVKIVPVNFKVIE